MNAYDEECLNDLAGRIEGVGRMVFHLVARLEDAGLIDGAILAEGLRHSIVLNNDYDVLMKTAKRTLDKAANSIDEARQWRRFRRQVDAPVRRVPGKRKAA